jgi:MFS family permease
MEALVHSVSVPVERRSSVLEGVTFYHWLVVFVAAACWLFDCMDQRFFALCREPALREIGRPDYVGLATGTMLFGWATGGIVFGIMSDRLGRRATMVVTLLMYSAFTGLSGIAHGAVEFLSYRFLTGMGVGGMFGAATTLVAESVPGGFRSMALGVLQVLSAVGNFIGSVISTRIQPGRAHLLFGLSGWRILFLVGILPALLVVPTLFVLREPEPWLLAKRNASGTEGGKGVGSIGDLLQDRRWREHLLVGVGLGLAGIGGLWGIGYFSPELISSALHGEPQNVVDTVRGWGTAMQDIGAFVGTLTFTFVATYIGRKIAFAGAFVLCLVSTIYVFNSLRSASDAYWMLPLMGFAQLSVFGGFAIYFPELFPTRLRGTGVSLCYNSVRYLGAGVPVAMSSMRHALEHRGVEEPIRMAASILASIFVLGLVTLVWAPETKDKPLPEG